MQTLHTYMLSCTAIFACCTANVDAQEAESFKSVAPFLSAETLAVARINVHSIDLDALINYVAGLRKTEEQAVDALAGPSFEDALNESMREPAAWQQTYFHAGGRSLYLLIELRDLYPKLQPLVVVETVKNADTGVLSRLFADMDVNGQHLEEIEGVPRIYDGAIAWSHRGLVIVGTRQQIERAQAYQPAGRPLIRRALAEVEAADLALVISPPEHARRAFTEILPATLPAGSTTVTTTHLSQGWLWAALGCALPPRPSARLVIETTGAEAAESLRSILNDLLDMAAQIKPLQENVPTIQRVIDSIRPKRHGQQLIVRLPADEFDKVAGDILLPAIDSVRRQASVTNTLHQVKQIMVGVHIYVTEHKNQLPENLEELVEKGYLQSELLHSPFAPPGKPAFVYIKPANMNAPQLICVHQNFDSWPDTGIAVGFIDGHAELVTNEARFNELLAEARAAAQKGDKSN